MDSLWISLFALLPGNNIPTASLVLGLIGLNSTTGLTIRLWRARARERLSTRWPFLLLVITGLYGYQVSTAFTAGGGLAAMDDAATLVFVFFGVGLARAWELLGLQGGGLLDLLATSVRQAVTGDGPEHEHTDGPRPEVEAGQ